MPSNGLKALLSGAWEGTVDSIKGIPAFAETLVKASPILSGNPGPAIQMIVQAMGSMTPEQRRFAARRAIRATGEIAGAGAGAASGAGLASIPLAGGGAVTGAAFGDYVATLLGLPREPPKSGEEGLHEVGKIFGGNATGQAVGEGVANLKKVAPMARNLVKRPFTPSAEQAQTNAIADRLNIPMTVAQRSGRKLPQLADAALDATPTGTGPIRAGREAAQAGAEDALERVKDSLHPTPVSPDSFVANEAKNSLATQRAGLDADVNAAAATAGNTLHPAPVTPHEGGRAMQGANDAAWGRFRSAAQAKFGPFLADNGGLVVDVPNLREAASHLLSNEVPPAAQSYFPSQTLKQLRSLAGMEDTVANDLTAELDKVAKSLGGKSAADLSPELQAQLRTQLEKQGLTDTRTPPQMSLQQLIDLRSRLLELGRSANSNTPGLTRRALGQIRSEVEAAIDGALAGKPQLQEFRDMNDWYRRNISRLDSDAARAIDGASFPEDVVTKNQIAQPGADERIGQAYKSTGLTDEGADAEAVGKFRRANFDQALRNATIDSPTGAGRVSPGRFRGYLDRLTPGTTEALYGHPGTWNVQEVAAPSLIARESELHGAPLANAIDNGNAQTVMGKVFPKQNPAAVQDARGFFRRTGDEGALQRASLQNLEDRSLATDRNIDASKRIVDWSKLERETGPGTGWGNSTDAMFGPAANSEVNDIVRVGKALGAPARNFGNTSRTTHVSHALGAGAAVWAGLTHPVTLPLVAGALAIPYGAAKLASNPQVAKWLTAPLEAMPAAAAGAAPAIGTAVRVPFAIKQQADDPLGDIRNLPVKTVDWFELNKPPDGDDWFEKNKPPE